MLLVDLDILYVHKAFSDLYRCCWSAACVHIFVGIVVPQATICHGKGTIVKMIVET